MSEIKAKFIGHPDGIYLPNIPVTTEGEPPRSLNIRHGGELPTEIDGHKVDTNFRDSLLDQKDNWSKIRRGETKDKTTAATSADKEG